MQAREIAKEVKEEAVRQVETTSWLTRQTRSKVMQKIATTGHGPPTRPPYPKRLIYLDAAVCFGEVANMDKFHKS